MRQKHINSIIKNEITLNMLKNLSQQSTPDEPKRLQSLIDYTRKLDLHVQQFARSDQIMLPELNFAPNALINLGPKYPARPFSYFDVLAHEENEVPLDDAKLLNEVARYFRGAIRPQSKHALFNMLPAPQCGSYRSCLARYSLQYKQPDGRILWRSIIDRTTNSAAYRTLGWLDTGYGNSLQRW